MTIDLRDSYKGNSAVVINDIISENSMEYWCYPFVRLHLGRHRFGTLYVNKDSEYGNKIMELLKTSPTKLDCVNDYCLEVMGKHLTAKDLHNTVSSISFQSERKGEEKVRQELRRVIGY